MKCKFLVPVLAPTAGPMAPTSGLLLLASSRCPAARPGLRQPTYQCAMCWSLVANEPHTRVKRAVATADAASKRCDDSSTREIIGRYSCIQHVQMCRIHFVLCECGFKYLVFVVAQVALNEVSVGGFVLWAENKNTVFSRSKQPRGTTQQAHLVSPCVQA